MQDHDRGMIELLESWMVKRGRVSPEVYDMSAQEGIYYLLFL